MFSNPFPKISMVRTFFKPFYHRPYPYCRTGTSQRMGQTMCPPFPRPLSCIPVSTVARPRTPASPWCVLIPYPASHIPCPLFAGDCGTALGFFGRRCTPTSGSNFLEPLSTSPTRSPYPLPPPPYSPFPIHYINYQIPVFFIPVNRFHYSQTPIS